MTDDARKDEETGEANDLEWSSTGAEGEEPETVGTELEVEPAELGDDASQADPLAADPGWNAGGDETSLTEPEFDPGPAMPSDLPENYTMLFCAVGLFVATMWLPMEGAVLDLYAKDSISGGFLAIFSAYAIFAGVLNVQKARQRIAHASLIVWPIFFAAADGLYISIKRLIGLIERIPAGSNPNQALKVFGPGVFVILLLSLFVIWTLLKSVMGAAKKDKARKEDARAAKAASRRA